MKKVKNVLMLALLMAGTTAMAQPRMGNRPQGPQGPGAPGQRPGREIQGNFELTPEQKAKMEKIAKSYVKKDSAAFAEFKAEREESVINRMKEFKSVLNKEQLAKLEKMQLLGASRFFFNGREGMGGMNERGIRFQGGREQFGGFQGQGGRQQMGRFQGQGRREEFRGEKGQGQGGQKVAPKMQMRPKVVGNREAFNDQRSGVEKGERVTGRFQAQQRPAFFQELSRGHEGMMAQVLKPFPIRASKIKSITINFEMDYPNLDNIL